MEQRLTICFKNVDDIKSFSAITTKSAGDFDIIEGHHILDGKSLMGMLALPFDTKLNLLAKNAEPECIAKVKELFSKEV